MRTSKRFLLGISISNRRHNFSLFYRRRELCEPPYGVRYGSSTRFLWLAQTGMRTAARKTRKHYGKKVKSRSNLCTLMDVNFSPVNKRDLEIRSRLPPIRHILDCIVRPFCFFLAPAIQRVSRDGVEKFKFYANAAV